MFHQRTAPISSLHAGRDRAGSRPRPGTAWLRADHVADLLTVMLILYTIHVLTPVLVAPDFINLELSSEVAETSESTCHSSPWSE